MRWVGRKVGIWSRDSLFSPDFWVDLGGDKEQPGPSGILAWQGKCIQINGRCQEGLGGGPETLSGFRVSRGLVTAGLEGPIPELLTRSIWVRPKNLHSYQAPRCCCCCCQCPHHRSVFGEVEGSVVGPFGNHSQWSQPLGRLDLVTRFL